MSTSHQKGNIVIHLLSIKQHFKLHFAVEKCIERRVHMFFVSLLCLFFPAYPYFALDST